MNTERCPYCLAPMATGPQPLKERLSLRQWGVYMAVVDAGPHGVASKDLLEKLAHGRKPGTLRTCVYSINKVIKPMRLDGRTGRYFLERGVE